ncbi:Obscurin-like protein 1 [Gossypium arboreum]|uniref:Obscurin-like protein 1 n=1 Tax=Gossypium arboreum TaxID=29729 RepID=A0A0B0NYZ6_GOSAR|nr:Obscurin-like protein 1 [Gossypium arboreum]
MARQTNTLFLEQWLRTNIGGISYSVSGHSSLSTSSSSARAIIQAWSEIRDSLQNQTFNPLILQSLKTLLNSQASLHVADPQAKLLLSVLSSRSFDLPSESYPILLRLLYIWVRKSFRPSTALIDLAVDVLSHVFATEFGSKKSPSFLAEGILILGAISFVPSVSESSKIACSELLCRLLEEYYKLVRLGEEIIPDVLAGIGYALSSSVDVHFVRVWDSLLGIWGKEDGPRSTVPTALMILHLVEWVVSGCIKSRSLKKIEAFSQQILGTSKASYVPFALVMVAAGVLRASRQAANGQGLEFVSRLRISAENQIAFVAQQLISETKGYINSDNDSANSLLRQCLSLALARSGAVSFTAPVLLCLASALLREIFPLSHLYMEILQFIHGSGSEFDTNEIKRHLDCTLFKEAGVITGVFCNQYVSADEDSKSLVESLIWDYCRDVYSGHRQVALLLRERNNELLVDLEKIAESAFLMVVVFALAVTKQRLNSNFSQEIQREKSVQILVSFSCLEYFRRMRLPEYMDTIRRVVACVQENESACISFVESMPTYVDLTTWQGDISSPSFWPWKADVYILFSLSARFRCSNFSSKQKMGYEWSKDEVQTARVLFYVRVIPTCIERLPAHVFRRVVTPAMFLYMGHPNGKVARASHSMFVAFMSSGKHFKDELVSLKEQLVFYYMQRSLEGYPDITPFEGMASGVAALVRHLPAGSPATFYCIHSLVDKANNLLSDANALKADDWKNWQGGPEPCKKILELLSRLISLVDIQVLPTLMKLLAQLIIQLPKTGQTMVLNELYAQVAESDDVTRKPTLVSWLQSLSYLSSQAKMEVFTSKERESKENSASPGTVEPQARL